MSSFEGCFAGVAMKSGPWSCSGDLVVLRWIHGYKLVLFNWTRGGIILVIIAFEELTFFGISCCFELVLYVFAGVHIFGAGLLCWSFVLVLVGVLGVPIQDTWLSQD